MKKVIITGPTGAIGTALIQELINNKVETLAVCRKNSARVNHIPKSEFVHILECDLDELSTLPQLVEGKYDTFFHFAWAGTVGDARNDMFLQNNNIKYTLEAVEVAHKLGCNKFIGAGSQAEYGRVEGKLCAETPVFPENGYGMAKLCAGQMSKVLCEKYGMQHIWTRVLSIYGPYDGMNTMVMSTISQLLRKEHPSCTKGEQQWDYLYSKDAGRAFYALGESGKNGNVYCIGSGTTKALKDYILAIRDAIDPAAVVGIGDLPYNDKQVMYLCANIGKLTEDTGFVPQYSFEDGIAETVEWCKENM